MFSRSLSVRGAVACLLSGLLLTVSAQGLEVLGAHVVPHMQLDTMVYREAPEPPEGARVQLFLQNTAPQEGPTRAITGETTILLNGQAPAALLEEGLLAWHDFPGAHPFRNTNLAPAKLTVWTFNSRKASLGTGATVALSVKAGDESWLERDIELARPEVWLSTVTFLAPENALHPNRMIVHIENASSHAIAPISCRLWLPEDPKVPHVLTAQAAHEELQGFRGQNSIPAGDKGGFALDFEALPLTYAAIEIAYRSEGSDTIHRLWAHQRIKPERFDISGGWVGDVTRETFLKALKWLYVDTAHLQTTPGYTDTELYAQYPLKYFNKLQPFEVYDTDEMLPRIHAVEFQGEPQYGGGTPVPPQKVWEEFVPYLPTRLPTSLTHSEERIWKDYAGLSDYPHYDAYRITAPAADAWWRYERWEEGRIAWAAPLETIGDLCRSLREMNRPMPCAIWSQGPHHDWGRYGGRERTSPTVEELRLQAYHALSTRITSLYWFNLSLKSLLKFPDLMPEMHRIGREMRMLDDLYLEGDAYRFERTKNADGKLDWDLASVVSPKAAALFALDLAYEPDREARVFAFQPPRESAFAFALPRYLGAPVEVFRVDADGAHDVDWEATGEGVIIRDTVAVNATYIASPESGYREALEAKHKALLEAEAALGFNPAANAEDMAALEALLEE